MTSILRSIGLKKSKHQKLSEEWTDCKEPVKEGMTFYCKYVGSTPIEQSSNVTMTSHAVKHIMSMAKAKGKKLPNIALRITPSTISGTLMSNSDHHQSTTATATTATSQSNHLTEVTINDNKSEGRKNNTKDNKHNNKSSLNKSHSQSESAGVTEGHEANNGTESTEHQTDPVSVSNVEPKQPSSPVQLFNISIYRIPYCFAENSYDRIVSFVATTPNGAHECHAIMADKRKNAHAIALTISSAFDIAFERMANSKASAANNCNGRNGAAKQTNDETLDESEEKVVTKVISTSDSDELVESSKSSNSESSNSDSGGEEHNNHSNANNPFPVLTLTRNLSFSRRRRTRQGRADKDNNDNKENSHPDDESFEYLEDEAMEVDHHHHHHNNSDGHQHVNNNYNNKPHQHHSLHHSRHSRPSPKLLIDLDAVEDIHYDHQKPTLHRQPGKNGLTELTLDELRDLF